VTTLLEVRELRKSYGTRRNRREVLHDVALDVPAGRSTGLVGESGSGKSTLIRCILGLSKPDSGTITYDGDDVVNPTKPVLRRFRRDVQLVFQDPYSSLNPRMTVEQLVSEGLQIAKTGTVASRRAAVLETLERVGLSAADLDRYPRSFSGGQRQRIAIARALVMQPRLLVCDEPVSALDVSVQAQILNLLQQLQQDLNLSILFVAHDLAVVNLLCDTVAVLDQGRVVETGPCTEVFTAPRDPYTQALIAAVPSPDPRSGRRRNMEAAQR
jgi:oligopeptide transport system ATP-binding protein